MDFDVLLADDQPEPPRSRLEPYLAYIRELRRRGRTFRRIAKLLEAQGVKVSTGTIHAFLNAKKRRRRAVATSEADPARLTTKPAAPRNSTEVVPGRKSPADLEEMRRAIREKSATIQPKVDPPNEFIYDPNNNNRKTKEK